MVALTAGAVACAPEGDAGRFLQGGPPTGILSHAMTVKTTLRNLMIVLVVRQTGQEMK